MRGKSRHILQGGQGNAYFARTRLEQVDILAEEETAEFMEKGRFYRAVLL